MPFLSATEGLCNWSLATAAQRSTVSGYSLVVRTDLFAPAWYYAASLRGAEKRTADTIGVSLHGYRGALAWFTPRGAFRGNSGRHS